MRFVKKTVRLIGIHLDKQDILFNFLHQTNADAGRPFAIYMAVSIF